MRKFMPQLEALEDRQVPTVTTSFNAGAGWLVILSNKSSDRVEIFQSNDTVDNATVFNSTTTLGVVVNNNFAGEQFFTGVTLLSLDMGDGNDTVLFHLAGDATGSTQGASLTVNGNLGKGNDVFLVDATSTPVVVQGDMNGVNSTIAFNVSGGKGNDTLGFNFLSGFGNISFGSTLTMNFSGGGDRDTFLANYFGTIGGTLNFNAQGGSGRDTVLANFSMVNDPAFGGTGNLNVNIAGNGGKDNVVLLASQNGFGSTAATNVNYFADKHDTILATALVHIFGRTKADRVTII